MVYRSFGKAIVQGEIWPAIAKPNRFGSLSSTTHLMAGDALSRGIAAIAIQARHPLQALRLCRDSGVRAILNHRLRNDVAIGHYSVLVDIDDTHVILHDPLYGPLRRTSHAELLGLWQPRFPTCEIAGSVLIALSAQPAATVQCRSCASAIPSHVECPKCKTRVSLQPGAILGCICNDCAGRIWEHICCPSCDHMLALIPEIVPGTFARIPAESGAATAVDGVGKSSAATLDVDKLFGAVDKFCTCILGMPGVANHPEIKKQLDHIVASKEKFRPAYAEELARSAMLQKQFAAIAKEAKEQKKAFHRKIEELNKPSPPLDGNALGHELLKNLGFVR
jgi:hypothetical protein